MNVWNVGFHVEFGYFVFGFDFIGVRLFPPGFWVFGYPTSSLFLGVFYYAFVQDVAYQRDYWPWTAYGDMTCLALEEFLGIYMC